MKTKAETKRILEDAARDIKAAGQDCSWTSGRAMMLAASRVVLDAAGVKDPAKRRAAWQALQEFYFANGNASATRQWIEKVGDAEQLTGSVDV
jgi:hypothetical protein